MANTNQHLNNNCITQARFFPKRGQTPKVDVRKRSNSNIRNPTFTPRGRPPLATQLNLGAGIRIKNKTQMFSTTSKESIKDADKDQEKEK